VQDGAKMYALLLERYPDSNEADTALYHLATLAYWNKDWARAKFLYQQLAEKYPDGRYTDFIAMQRLPEIITAMNKSKPKDSTREKS
jgi:outer membrane protein assembly factor BamD (BamD/ComL family)